MYNAPPPQGQKQGSGRFQFNKSSRIFYNLGLRSIYCREIFLQNILFPFQIQVTNVTNFASTEFSFFPIQTLFALSSSFLIWISKRHFLSHILAVMSDVHHALNLNQIADLQKNRRSTLHSLMFPSHIFFTSG